MKNKYTVCAGALALTCTAVDARAQTTVDTPPSEVIVTATRSARSLSEVPVSASLLTEEDIQDTPSQSLDDVLRHVSVRLPIEG